MDHLRVNLGTLKSAKQLPLSILFGIKNSYFDIKKSVKISNNKLSVSSYKGSMYA